MADSSIVIADLQGKLRPTVPEQVPAVRWRFCVLTDPPKAARFRAGEMSEWSKVPDSKSGVSAMVPRVRIPLSPQDPYFHGILER